MGKAGLVAFLGVLLSGVPSPRAADSSTLRVGTSGDYEPFSFDAGGTPGGFDVALAKAYAAERGLGVELVRFRWPDLLGDLAAGRFDVVMSGITVRPRRSVVGRFTVPVTESGAVALVRDEGRFRRVEQLDQRGVRIGVNAGGHLERVSRARFTSATLLFIPDNQAVLPALLDYGVDAVVSDSFEGPRWRERHEDLVQLGPFTRDRKAYLVRADRSELAADLDAWLLAREADGSLQKLRREHLGARRHPATAAPLAALVAALDERLALMPWVVAAKRRDVRPIADPLREKRVLGAAVAAVAAAAERAGREPLPEEAVRAFFTAQIEAAKQVQLTAGRVPEPDHETAAPDLEKELRPALVRIGERIAALLLVLPTDLDRRLVSAAALDGLRSPHLSDASRRALVEAIVSVSRPPAPPKAPETASEPGPARADPPAPGARGSGPSAAGRSSSPGSEPPRPRSGGAPTATSP